MIRLATAEGIIRIDPRDPAGPRDVTLEGQGVRAFSGPWVVLDDGLVATVDATLDAPVKVDGLVPWCVCELDGRHGGAVVGTSEARLFRVSPDGDVGPVASFDAIPTRDEWYTPWGAPPDTRSLAVTSDGDVLVNVHVGGIWSGRGLAGEWRAVVDVDADVHQVVAAPDRPVAAAAAAIGCGVSLDGGRTWRWSDEGLHGPYCRAVAIAGDAVLVSASTGPSTRFGALYRRGLESDGPFERCGGEGGSGGLPDSFPFNLDTFSVAASGNEAVLGTGDGRLYRSVDQGSTWDQLAGDLPAIRAVDIS